MTVREQARYWLVGFAAFSAALWLLAGVLAPFVLGAAIAYLMDPAADWLERHGFSRLLATVTLTVLIVGLAGLAVVLVFPLFASQLEDLLAAVPGIVGDARTAIATYLPHTQDTDGFVAEALDKLRASAQDWSINLLQRIGDFGLAVASLLGLAFVTPVVAFYLLMDWDRLIAIIDDYLPRQHRATIRVIARDLDRVLAGFVRGQLTVCLILGTFYAIALSAVGLQFGLLIGLFAGLISFIPFVGSIFGGALSIGVALAQFWAEWPLIAAVAAIFLVGQAVEGNFLTPKLVGDKVGLHPVWLMFALSAFGGIFGFIGLLVAVPCAAAIGVVGRFLAVQYKAGRLYKGTETDAGLHARDERANPQ